MLTNCADHLKEPTRVLPTPRPALTINMNLRFTLDNEPAMAGAMRKANFAPRHVEHTAVRVPFGL